MSLPLHALLAQALGAVTQEYVQRGAGSPSLPSLAVWSNVLRPVGDGIDLRQLPRAARLSRRAVRPAVRAALTRGWLVQDGNTVRPSASGASAQARWPALDAERSIVDDVTTPLRALVHRLHLEWPHYPTPYGPADHSITGGVYAPGMTRNDPKIPRHGSDWAPVLRQDIAGSSVAGVPLSALLSQAFVAFAAEFEELGIGGLHLAASVLRLLPDDGMPLGQIRVLGPLRGDGKSVLERHRFIQIIRAPAQDHRAGGPLVVPTSRGIRTRDRYDATARQVEDRWQHEHGADDISRLREALESVDVDRSSPHSVIDTLT